MVERMDDFIKAFKDVNIKNLETVISSKTDYLEQRVLDKLAVYISQTRKAKHLTVRQLHLRSLVSLAVINDLEKARSMPRVETLIRLGLALEVGFNNVFRAMILEDFVDIEEDNSSNLAMDISKYGYDKNEVSEIMDFIKFIDFKKNKCNSNEINVL